MFLDVSIALKHPGEPYAFRVEQEIATNLLGRDLRFLLRWPV